MNCEEHPEDDSLDELLSAPRVSISPDAVRDAVMQQSAGILRRRRWVRRGSYLVTLAICYLAGLATMAVVRQENPPTVSALTEPRDASPDEASSDVQNVVPQIAEGAEVFADQVTPTRASFGFFRSAGDYQLLQRGNLQAAVRLYSQALDLASPADLAISAGSDSWLLMSLKQSRLQDAPHVHDEG
jgi:hypothetical protein